MAGVQCVCVCASVFACGCPGEAVGGSVSPRGVLSVWKELRECVLLAEVPLTAQGWALWGQGGDIEAGMAPGRGLADTRTQELCPSDPRRPVQRSPACLPDVDECRMLAHLCPHGECINSLGSFRCRCQTGYRPDAAATACLGEPPHPHPGPASPPAPRPRPFCAARSPCFWPEPEAAPCPDHFPCGGLCIRRF